MIIFLNFAPIDFMGGAEKLMLELAAATNRKEEVIIVDVSPKISNLYGRLVLKRTFDDHIQDHNLKKLRHISLTYRDFIPFTKNWFKIRKIFKNAKICYVRYEFPEIALSLFYGGKQSLSKIIGALILTPYYESPRGFIDRIHNFLYGPFLYGPLIRSTKKVHVLNKRDKKLLEKRYHAKKVHFLPVGINFSIFKVQKHKNNFNYLNIIYVGELSTRKGVDIICEVIEKCPPVFNFHIIGDGPLKSRVIENEKQRKCKYYGYINMQELHQIYSNCDVLLFPSRAEAFGIVMAEAMAFGLKIVNSAEVSLNLPSFIETTVSDRNIQSYISELETIYIEKQNSKIDREKIINFAKENYSAEKINSQFVTNIIGI